MATAQEMNYSVTETAFDYLEAGKRCHNMDVDRADACFDDLAKQYGVKEGPYGSWDMFWLGYWG